MVTGIIADEGLPERDVRRAIRLIDADVDVVTETFLASDDGGVDKASEAEAREIARRHGWDRAIYVTDQALVGEDSPEIYQVQAGGELVVISVSALGIFRVAHRLATVLGNFLDSAQDRRATPARRGKLFFGLVRANQPWRLLPVLKGVLVGIAATGGFGIFYGSIWSLSQAVSYPRLILLSIVAVAVLTTSLITINGLWQRPRYRSPRWLGYVDNAVTATTIFLTGVVVFLLAVTGLTALSVVIAPADYVAEQISSDTVNAVTYLRIGWFSANLGVLAGAIASNFDRTPEIRSAVHNPREYARRQREGSYED